jgi:hypothetical protein
MDYIEMRDFLKQQNKTDVEMQMMWDYCVNNGHKLIVQLDRCGQSWTDMNTYALATLEREYNKLKLSLK